MMNINSTVSESALENNLDKLNIVIAAAEDWAKSYSKDNQSHAKLIRLEANFARELRRYFKSLAKERVIKYLNLPGYREQVVKAYDIKVIFDEDSFNDEEDNFILNVLHDPILEGMGIGVTAAQNITGRNLGLSKTDAAVQEAARKQAASLVKGINQTTKDRINQSIRTSLELGESDLDAAERISNILNDPNRALTIARTESVNSYNQGLLTFGDKSGAVAKQWYDVGADDICAENSAQGAIDIGDDFESGDNAPPAHPNCRCGMQLIYPDGSEEEGDEEDI